MLLLSLLFSSTGFVFAIDEPEKPIPGDLTNNESIQEYNTKVEDYNKKVDEYNTTINAEYEAAAEYVKQQNETGLKAQEESQKAYDEAIVVNEQATIEANRQNEEIDKQNAENQQIVDEWNTAEDKKTSERLEEIANTISENEQNKKEVEEFNKNEDQKVIDSQVQRDLAIEENKAIQEHNAQEQAKVEASEKAKTEAEKRNVDNEAEVKAHNEVVEANYQAALQAEAERIAQLEADNKIISAANQAELDRVAKEEQINTDAKATIDAENAEIIKRNAQAQAQYDEEYKQYCIDKEEYDKQSAVYLNNFNTQYNVNWSLEEYEAYAKAWNEKYKKDSKYHEAAKDKGVAQKDTTDDNFDFTVITTNNQTINVIPSDNPAEGEDYYVTNIHIYYDGPNDIYYGNAFNLEKNNKLDPRNKSGIVQVKYETVKVNKNDTVTLTSEIPKLIKYSNGNFFNYVDDNHLEGYWHLGSCEYGYLTETEEGYNYGPTYTFSYADTTPLSHVYTVYTYDWSGKYDVLDAPESPVLTQEELKTFTPKEIIPAAIQKLNEIIPKTIIKEDLWETNPIEVPEIYAPQLKKEQEIPDIYTPQYKTFVSKDIPDEYVPIYKTYTTIEHVIPTLVEIPQIVYWTSIKEPTKPTYLNHLNIIELLPESEPTIEPEPTIEEPVVEPVVEPVPIIDETEPIKEIVEEKSDPIADEPIIQKEPANSRQQQTQINNVTSNITIAEAPTPLTNKNKPTTPIVDSKTPKAAPQGSWALLNLIATILSCVCAVILLFVKKKTKEDEPTEEEKRDKRGILGTKTISVLVGIISIILFIFTEDMTLPMVFTDKWTILMILLLIIEIINIFVIRQQSKGEKDDD